MNELQLGVKTLSTLGDEIYIIAEIGQNHQGSIETAKKMILEAKHAGCDCVKFQKSDMPTKFTKAALNRRYTGENSWGNTYGEHKQYLEFTSEQYKDLQRFCKNMNIDFTASAMDEVSLDFLYNLGVPFIKIGSGDANNFPMLEKAATLPCPLIISTGMQSIKTIKKIVGIMKSFNKINFALLHCVSSYPTDPIDCTLQTITLLKETFPHIIVGYSGHELGIDISKASILLGARILERHMTLDKSQKGSDHKCSLDPREFSELVKDINNLKPHLNKTFKPSGILHILGYSESVFAALQDINGREILPCELNCKQKLGKSIVAARNLQRGHKLLPKDIWIKVSEPNGIFAEEYETVIEAILLYDIEQDNPIMAANIKHL